MGDYSNCGEPTEDGPPHKHKCVNCGKIWEHGSGCCGDRKAHTCPDCKSEQWNIYREHNPETSA